MLERLELNYFKKHEHLVLNFTAGLNGLMAPNYCGKTTVLYGILFCLGGARMVPGTRLHTRGTNSGFRQVLTLSFTGKGRYKIERTKNGATLTELCPDNTEQPVATGTNPVNQAISRLLGMPLKRFAQIKYAKQRKAASLLEAGSTELFKIITELTGLERVGLVMDRVAGQLKAWRLVQDETPLTDISEQQQQVLSWLTEETGYDTELAALVKDLTALKVSRTEAGDHERRLSTAQTAVYSATTTVRQAEQEVTNARATLDEAERKMAEFRGAPLDEDTLAELEQRLTTLREQLQTDKQVRYQAKQIEGDLQSAQADLQRATDKTTPLREVAESLRNAGTGVDLDTLHEAAADTKAAVQTCSVRLQALIEAGKDGVCEACQRPFEAFDPQAHNEHVERLQEELRLKMLAADDAKTALDAGITYRTELALAESRLGQAGNHVHALQQACTRLSNQLQTASLAVMGLPPIELIAPQIDLLQAQISNGRQDAQRQATLYQNLTTGQTDLLRRSMALEAARSALQQIQIEHQVVGVDLPTALQHHRMEADRLDNQIRRLNEQATGLGNQQHAVHQQRIALERSLMAAAERNRQHEQAALKVIQLTELLGHIRNNRDRYSKQVWDVFMASASMFASNATGGVIESISRGEDGAFTFIEDGFEMEQAEASGAQLAIIGTAVQLALDAAALSPLNLVLLDEPTADMDPERALAFSTLLVGSGKQVVMVSHREMDATVFDNTLEI
jgi:DNA repair exonuclease SbcCD ATPase subunit